MIQVDDVRKHFGPVQALAGVSFTARDGQTTALLGPNGAGKTTLLRLLVGLLQRDQGAISIDGLDPAREPLKVHNNIGFLTDQFGLYERLTTREHLAYFGELHGMDAQAIRRRSDEVVGLLAMDDIIDLLRLRKQIAVIRISKEFSDNYSAMRPARIELWYDSAADQQSKLRRLNSILRSYNSGIASARLLAHGVSPAALAPIQLQEYDTSTSVSRSASFIGALLGMFFAAAFFFCLNTAMDTTAGERERRSLEVLLAQPVRPFELIAGKWLATAALAMNAKSFKEAQAMMGFAVLVPMLPAVIVPMMDLNTALWMYTVPVLSNQTLLRELSKGQALGVLPFVLTAGSALLAAALAVGFATWRLKSESYVLAV